LAWGRNLVREPGALPSPASSAPRRRTPFPCSMSQPSPPASDPASVRPGAAPLSGGPAVGVWRNVSATVRLALPVMIARSGTLVMITADVVMTGRFRAAELAFYGLGYMAHQVLYVLGQGAMMGATVLASQADGMGEPWRSGTVWRVGLLHSAVLGVLFAGLCLLGEPFFLAAGQTPLLAREGGAVLRAFALGLPPLLMYVATALFLEGISRPRANMWLMLVANGLNVGLNWLLIYPHAFSAPWLARLGLSTLGGRGAVGAALATAATRWFMFLALAAYVLLMREREHFGVRGRLHYPLDIGRKLRRLGGPLMLAQGLESASFLAVALMAGWLGTRALAVYQIAANVNTIVFMLALGLATATSVRVGNAVGRGDRPGLAWAGWSGAGLGLVLLAAIGLAFQPGAGPLVAIYTEDPAVQALAAPAVTILGLVVVLDGGQALMVGALRGLGDIVVPSCMAVGGFWVVNVPLAWWLGVARGGGVSGLLWALAAGTGVATTLLLLRFARVSRREIRPV
jgi:MATE family, multidrug efflux pump